MSLDVPTMTKCVETKCWQCDVPIWVPTWDFNEARNYCYPCAWTRLAS